MTKEKEPTPKVVFEEHITCPHCKKGVVITKTRKLTNEPTKAEYEEKTRVAKDPQKKLSEVS